MQRGRKEVQNNVRVYGVDEAGEGGGNTGHQKTRTKKEIKIENLLFVEGG